MRTTLFALPALLVLAACDGGGGGGTLPTDGPVEVGFVNTRQTAEVAAGFSQPVVGKAVRQRTTATPWFSLVTPLYADTAVVGAPAAGVETCFLPTAESNSGGPQPDALCKKTGADGKVAYTFSAGTRAATYRLPACVKNAQNICTYPDTLVLVVLPKPPAFARVQVGDVGTRGGDAAGRATFDPNMFLTADKLPAAFRVEGLGWLRSVSDTVGAPNALRVDILNFDQRQVGDTASVRFHSATGQIAEARVRLHTKFGEGFGQSYLLELTYRAVALPYLAP